MDQLTALAWVQKNIANFGTSSLLPIHISCTSSYRVARLLLGGDPNRVTIYGQSAGGTSVSSLMASPAVQAMSPPLFHQAIIHSNPWGIPIITPSDGVALFSRFAKDVNCASTDLACLRNATVSNVLTAQAKSAKHLNISDFFQVGYPWAPAIGKWLPDHPLYLFAKNQVPKIPVMMGTVNEEGRLFVFDAEDKSIGSVEYVAFVTLMFKKHFLKV